MERLTERTADGILVKENHCENGLRTFYQCFEEKPSGVSDDVCECRLLNGYNFLHKTSCEDVF